MRHAPDSIAATFDIDDLRELAGHPGPFLSVVLPTPSEHADADHRFDVRWKNARRDAEAAGWPDVRLAELDALVAGWQHGDSAAMAIVQAADGHRVVESMVFEVTHRWTSVDTRPRLLPIVENRQRTLPHLVVMADRAGADIVGFDGGSIVADHTVEGETLHIHRGHPGGWSQRRFQQRAENTWETNADTVADSVVEMASTIQPVVIAVAGPERASTLVVKALTDRIDVPVELLDAGDPDGAADETIRLVDDRHARYVRDAIEALREALGTGGGSTGSDVLGELTGGRVETLLVDDPESDEATTAGTWDRPADRLVDRAVGGALATGASIVIVPSITEMSDGVASIARW